MSERKFESTAQLYERYAADMREVINTIKKRNAIPVNISYTLREASRLIQLPDENIPFDTIAAHLVGGNSDTVRIGFEIPSMDHQIGSVALRYYQGKVNAEYDKLIEQLLNDTTS